jgi:hypothetical protein
VSAVNEFGLTSTHNATSTITFTAKTPRTPRTKHLGVLGVKKGLYAPRHTLNADFPAYLATSPSSSQLELTLAISMNFSSMLTESVFGLLTPI